MYRILFNLFVLLDARTSQIDDEWEANTPAKLQSMLPDMYSLLINNPSSMKLFSSSGVLPGSNSSTGATGTYKPSSQTCSNGCGLDGSGCGSQGNSFDVDPCSAQPPTAPTPTAPTPTAPSPTTPTGGELNGEEACENKGYTRTECLNVGDGSCCQFDEGECWSDIGTNLCPGSGGAPSPTAPTPTAPTPSAPTPTAPTPTAPTPSAPTPTAPTPSAPTPTAPTPSAPTPSAPTPTAPTPSAPTPSAPTPTAPTPSAPTPTGGLLDGEEACENKGYTRSECLSVGDGSCCQFDEGECWSDIGTNLCPGTGGAPSPSAPTPTAPSPTGQCNDSSLRFRVKINGSFKMRDCTWASNRPFRCRSIGGVASHCRDTCGQCSICDDANLKFKVQLNGKLRSRNCVWVKTRSTNYRCRLPGVKDTCPETCGTCSSRRSIFT